MVLPSSTHLDSIVLPSSTHLVGASKVDKNKLKGGIKEKLLRLFDTSDDIDLTQRNVRPSRCQSTMSVVCQCHLHSPRRHVGRQYLL